MEQKAIWAARRAANAQQGDGILDDPHMRKSLLFQRHDNVIFDGAGELNLAYFFPSAVGSALFYYGHFELGEIEFVTRLLQDVPSPIVLDIGANVGSHSLEWAHRLKTAQIFAFEPAPSNYELLRRNIDENYLSDRVFAVGEAVGAKPGSATFFETDDGAYSSLQDTQRRPVRTTYEVAVTTVDEFVQNRNLPGVSLIKVDVEGTEDDVLAGARRTLERFAPLLFLEIYGGQHSNPDPERTIASVTGLGYIPYVISDGVPTAYEAHDDNFYNYLFVHESRLKTLPAPDLRLKRLLDAERLELLDKLTADLRNAAVDVGRAQRQWTKLDQAARDKEKSLKEKDRALQEISRLSRDLETQLQEKDRALREIAESSRSVEVQLQEKDRALRQITESSHGLETQLQDKHRALQELSKASHELEVQLQEKDRVIQQIAKSSHELEIQLQEKDRALLQIMESSRELETQLRDKDKKLEEVSGPSPVDSRLREKESDLQRITESLRDLERQLREKERALQECLQASRELELQLQEKERTLLDTVKAANLLEPQLTEKEALIQRLQKAAENLTSQLQSQSRQVEEKDAAMKRYEADMREKDALIGRFNAEISENARLLDKLYAELDAKQAAIEPMSKEMELLRHVAEERLATANELNDLAQERLAVIVSLNERLHQLQSES